MITLAVAGLFVLVAVLFAVTAVRMWLRVIALKQAIAFYQAPGTNGKVTELAEIMFMYIVSGRVRK
jgi:hypothetical protein